MHQILLVVIFLSVSRTINLRPMFLECSSLLNTSHFCLFIIYQKWSTLKLVRTQSLKHITVVHTFDTMVWFQLLNIADLWSDSCSVQISDASRMVKAALLTTNEINMLDVLNFWLILKITFWQIWHYIFEVQSIYILKTTWPYMCLSSSLHTHCSLWNIEACNEPKFPVIKSIRRTIKLKYSFDQSKYILIRRSSKSVYSQASGWYGTFSSSLRCGPKAFMARSIWSDEHFAPVSSVRLFKMHMVKLCITL